MVERHMEVEPVHAMEITRRGGDAFHLFLDLFVHGSRTKLSAVTAYYGDDIDWSQHGVRLDDMILRVEGLEIRGTYLPHRLDSWEPAIVIDFEHEALPALIEGREWLDLEIEAGPHRDAFRLSTAPTPAFEVAMSVIVRDENRWIGHYLQYYLDIMDVDHVFVYDNNTRDRETLLDILEPYRRAGQVTYIPWHYRWRNRKDLKQIGQPPQQSHTLGRFANSKWIGFFDVDEFLRIPGKTLPEFLQDYDPATADGLSFGIRWFFYQGSKSFEEIDDPLLEMLYCRRDPLGRKRQKLVVSAQNVRFLRFHWLEEGKREVAIDDGDIFFHHYYNRLSRFNEGLGEPEATRDGYMLRFADRLSADRRPRGEAPARRAKPASTAAWIAHVERALANSEAGRSRLSEEVAAVEGMCGRNNRILLNELCNFDGCRYLEVGSHAGASLCAALFGNQIDAVAIENWSEFGGPREEFIANVSRFQGDSAVEVIEEDCFKVDLEGTPPFDVFFYDGNHSFESHDRALRHFTRFLSGVAVVVVDDWNWPRVRRGTKKSIEDLGLNVLYRKEIVLSDADVEDMPRHRGAETWWNGVCVLVIEGEGESEQARVTTTEPIEVVVFSKDRACQLEALLRSMDELFIRPHYRHVLHHASEPGYEAAYAELAREHPEVDWVREEDFRSDFLKLVRECAARSRFLMFLVDDIAFTRSFDGQWHLETLDEDPDVLAVCLRLGENVRFCHPRNAATTPPDLSRDPRWAWKTASPGYWNYPMSQDGNIFRSRDLVDYFPTFSFHNPNSLESATAGRPLEQPLLAAEPEPYLVNLALNRVQDTYRNPSAGISTEWLNQRYLEGARVDIHGLRESQFDSCHIEPEIEWLEAPMRSAASSRESSGRWIDLREIPIFVIHCEDDPARREFIEEQFGAHELDFRFAPGTRSEPPWVGQNLSHLRLLERDDLRTPFLVLEDDCQLGANFETRIRVPADADAVYLGTSLFGIEQAGEPSPGLFGGVEWAEHDAEHVRIYNMLSRHAVLFVTDVFRQAVRERVFETMLDGEHAYPGDVGYAVAQETHRVYARITPLFYQSERFSPNHVATRASLCSG